MYPQGNAWRNDTSFSTCSKRLSLYTNCIQMCNTGVFIFARYVIADKANRTRFCELAANPILFLIQPHDQLSVLVDSYYIFNKLNIFPVFSCSWPWNDFCKHETIPFNWTLSFYFSYSHCVCVWMHMAENCILMKASLKSCNKTRPCAPNSLCFFNPFLICDLFIEFVLKSLDVFVLRSQCSIQNACNGRDRSLENFKCTLNARRCVSFKYQHFLYH